MALKPRKSNRKYTFIKMNGVFGRITEYRGKKKTVRNFEGYQPLRFPSVSNEFHFSSFKPDTETKHYFGTTENTIHAETKKAE